MGPYQKHVFVCINQRPKVSGSCCASKKAEEILESLKLKVKSLKLKEKIRVNKAGCLGQCESGPVLVIYPQGIWYRQVQIQDVDEIIEKSLLANDIIDRLCLKPL